MTARKLLALFVLYIIGGLFTNSYCQIYRWGDWVGDNTSSISEIDTGCKLAFTTVLWPLYWASKGTTELIKAGSVE